MAATDTFNLADFLTESLSLHLDAALPTRNMIPFPDHEPYREIFEQDPLDVLGERSFGKPQDIPEHVTGTQIQEFYRGVNVLITGGTGFIGKVLTEKLVRSIPHLGHIYLLIRAKRGKTTSERFDHLLEDQLFSRVKTEVPHYRSKIMAVDGDITEPGLGLSPADRQLLIDTVHVVFHSAATVKFTEPLRVAMNINVLGGKRMVDLAKQMRHLKAFVYVSTAYSQCVRRVIEERVPKLSVNYREILKYVDMKTDEDIEGKLARILQGWPNTYSFSKAVCEDMMQEEAKDLPVCIFRPSIIIPTYKEPVRGWTNNLYGPTGICIGVLHGVLHCLWADQEMVVDVVPVDYVVNCMIATAWKTATCRESAVLPVYNFTSSPVNPFIWKTTLDVASSVIEEWPFTNAIWYPSFFMIDNYIVHELAYYLLHKIPGMFFDRMTELAGQKPRLNEIYGRLRAMQHQLRYFLTTPWEFKNDNVMELWRTLSDEDKTKFYFDLRDFDVKKYLLYGKIGARYYYLKDKMETIPAAKRKNMWLYWLHNTVKFACCLVVLKLMVETARVLPF